MLIPDNQLTRIRQSLIYLAATLTLSGVSCVATLAQQAIPTSHPAHIRQR